MRRTWIRRAVAVFFMFYLLAVIWPVASWFGAPEPFILGLPLSLAWPVAWIVLGFLMLLLLDHGEHDRNDA
jgi:hypothetical protein